VSNEETIQKTQIKESPSGRQVCGLGLLQGGGFNRTKGIQLRFAPTLQQRGIVRKVEAGKRKAEKAALLLPVVEISLYNRPLTPSFENFRRRQPTLVGRLPSSLARQRRADFTETSWRDSRVKRQNAEGTTDSTA